MQNSFNHDRIEQAIQFLTNNFQDQPDLDQVAKQMHISPFHFQRLFTDWVGISPKRFMQFLTTKYLKSKLHQTKNLAEAASVAGLSAQSRVYDLFVNLEAVTPQEYKTHGEGLSIQYAFHPTPFGECLIGVTERGICGLSFVTPDQRQAALSELQNHWQNAHFTENEKSTAPFVNKIFSDKNPNDRITLLVKGTNFQIKVWEALLKIPTGGLATYQDIAQDIGSPKAMQAVGSAIGANSIAYLIPCHRVIKKQGLIGGYRWGTPKKQAIIGWELSISDR